MHYDQNTQPGKPMNLVKNLSPFGKFILVHIILFPMVLWPIHTLSGSLCDPNNLNGELNFDLIALYAHAYTPMIGFILELLLCGLLAIELYEALLEARWQQQEKQEEE